MNQHWTDWNWITTLLSAAFWWNKHSLYSYRTELKEHWTDLSCIKTLLSFVELLYSNIIFDEVFVKWMIVFLLQMALLRRPERWRKSHSSPVPPLFLLFRLLNVFVMFQHENAPEEDLLQCSLPSTLNLSMDKSFGHANAVIWFWFTYSIWLYIAMNGLVKLFLYLYIMWVEKKD